MAQSPDVLTITVISLGFFRLTDNNSRWSQVTSPPVGFRSIAISVSVCLSVHEHISKTGCPNFTKLYQVHVVVARSASGGVAIRYVLPVLWMTSCFHTGIGDPKRTCAENDSPGVTVGAKSGVYDCPIDSEHMIVDGS